MRSVPGAVATGLSSWQNSTVAWIETRSLPLPVLTASSFRRQSCSRSRFRGEENTES